MIVSRKIQQQNGNILIYILGAIFLLGLLAAMVKGSNTPGAGIDYEKVELQVQEVQQYGNELERAVAYILRNGHSESDIRFAHPDASVGYGVITDTPTRQVFDKLGGGAEYRFAPDGTQLIDTDWLFSGGVKVGQIGTIGPGTETTELLAILQNVNREFCLLVNRKNNIDNPGGDAPLNNGSIPDFVTIFTGTFTNSEIAAGGAFDGKHEGCLRGAGTPPVGTYHYYRVLLPR